jgi:GNAT superfamily N-acetyltransferase
MKTNISGIEGLAIDHRIRCARMTPATRVAACDLLAAFLGADAHYRTSASSYGDGGPAALERALDLFLARPELGFVWLAHDARGNAVGCCVVCYAISTSRGAIVVKLDDVTVRAELQSRGIGRAMLQALAAALRAEGIGRIDTACHRSNGGAWRFYERLGFRPLDEERIALVL